MIARIRKSIDEKDQGFTLIELLVVIIIIGILAAIAIPVFLNQRKKAVDASIKSDLRTVANEMETYYTDAQTYPAAVPTHTAAVTANAITISGNAVSLSSNNQITITYDVASPNTQSYCVRGTNTKGSNSVGWFYISNKGGLQPSSTTTCTF
ncbi:prepilin-type N-terminal cleavage/methylation domain-containing protein [Cellulomonas humilata]|uniref:Prepilin-type N-terminal cleavage/methylation domain-containing protein n=1 Tax=Cellulomonas humilata TaxID=144055 RepID=A0A7Y6A0Q1_9CELL|nr:prepilin-type N-terminal cleavage/methylation domain-containing protein [Cellulomonas humilata]NUU17653.1 prepilin-type N-terminal cleavage/methylation domain-containing protein [Cellulomonas humilata]